MASQIRVSPNTEGVPLISQGARTPITSAGGSGGAGLGKIGYDTRTTDLTGAGAILGGLMGSVIGRGGAGGTGGNTTKVPVNPPPLLPDGRTSGVDGGPGGGTFDDDGFGDGGEEDGGFTDEEIAEYNNRNRTGGIPITDPKTGKPAGTMTPNTPFVPPGGYPSRDTPTMGVDAATQSIQFAPGTTQFDIDKYAPGYQIAGVNMANGNVIATPNYMLGPDFAPVLGRSDLYTGGGYTPGTDIIGPDFSGASSGIFGTDFSIGPNFTPTLGRSDSYTGGGYDPSLDNLADFSFDSGSNFDVADLGNDFSFDNSFDFGDLFNFDDSYLSDSGSFFDDIGSGVYDTFSDIGSGIGDFFDFGDFDFGSFFAKDGGLATPMYANGGGVRGYANGSSVNERLSTTLREPELQGGYGFDLSGFSPEQVEVILHAMENDLYTPANLAEISQYDPTRYNANAFNPLYRVVRNSESPTGYSKFMKPVNADGSAYNPVAIQQPTRPPRLVQPAEQTMLESYGTSIQPAAIRPLTQLAEPAIEAGGYSTTEESGGSGFNVGNLLTGAALGTGLGGLTNIFSGGIGNTLLGAGLGAGIGSLLGEQTSNTSTGVDMSQIGKIAPRTTSFGMGPAKVVPYSQYGTPAASTSDYSQLMESLGAPVQMAEGGSTYYTFGKEVDPIHNLQGELQYGDKLKGGGLPKATTPMTPEGRHDYRQGAYVDGIGDGQSDDIPAMLADGEYVIDSETVSALGNGSNKAGAKVLDQFRHGVRSHKRSAPLDKIPPKAKSPLEYIRMGAKMKGAK